MRFGMENPGKNKCQKSPKHHFVRFDDFFEKSSSVFKIKMYVPFSEGNNLQLRSSSFSKMLH